jgi:nitroimidazol reductase NimA-like FMN-containing flavoprotein (pyridoxamine 5'-phosphate oxidase superfamily)
MIGPGAVDVIDGEALARIQEASYERAGHALSGSWPAESAMDSAQLAAFLDERRFCVLATTNAEGHAQARPVGFTVLGNVFWFATVQGRRLRNLERMPWASLVVADGERGFHRAVTADGPAKITEEPPDELLAVWEERHGSRPGWASAWFEINPTRVFSYGGSDATA